MKMTNDDYFRASVGMLVLNCDGLILVGHRVSEKGAWQAPQGGLAKDEQPIEAAYRELAEEVGLIASDIDIIAEYPEWLAYELPPDSRNSKTGLGQVQKWFLFRFNGREEDIRLAASESQEFDQWAWWPMTTLVKNVWPPRRPTYERLANAWHAHLETTIPGPSH